MKADFRTIWRDAGRKRHALWLVLFSLLIATAIRAILTLDIDAFSIVGLTAMLLWTQVSEARRNASIRRKLDHYQNLQRYGRLTEDDRHVIAALKAGTSRQAREPQKPTSGAPRSWPGL